MNKNNSFTEMLNSTFAVVILVITMSFMPKSAMGQALQGEFKYAQDGHVYFYLYNPTGYSIPVVWGTSSGDGREYQNQGVMMGTNIQSDHNQYSYRKSE